MPGLPEPDFELRVAHKYRPAFLWRAAGGLALSTLARAVGGRRLLAHQRTDSRHGSPSQIRRRVCRFTSPRPAGFPDRQRRCHAADGTTKTRSSWFTLSRRTAPAAVALGTMSPRGFGINHCHFPVGDDLVRGGWTTPFVAMLAFPKSAPFTFVSRLGPRGLPQDGCAFSISEPLVSYISRGYLRSLRISDFGRIFKGALA